MRTFRWISTQDIPEAFDLRREGWRMVAADEERLEGLVVVHSPTLGSNGWLRLLSAGGEEARRLMLVCGVDAPAERVALLELGVGDVLEQNVSPVEYHARALRLAKLTYWLPRRRTIGPLQLDLLARDAFFEGSPLSLKALEFGLLWRLSDSPDVAVSRQALIHDVWRLAFMPATNSLAVHMSRLRARLANVGLAHIVQTTPGGYCLRMPDADYPAIHPGPEIEQPLMSVLSGMQPRTH